MPQLRASYKPNDTLKKVGYAFTYGNKVINIDPANIVDAQFTWDANDMCVEGYVLFDDVYRVSEMLPPVNTILFRMSGTDFSGMTYEEKFVITRIEKQYSNNRKMSVMIELIDTAYYYLGNTYVSKGYNNIRIDQIAKDIVSNRSIFPNGITQKLINFYPTNNTYENMVIPTERPFTAFIKQKELTDGFSFYQSRKEIVMLSHDKIETHLPDIYGNGEGIKFTFDDVDDTINPFKIKTLRFIPSDNLLFNAVLPDTMVYQFDQSNMSNPDVRIKDVGRFSKTLGDDSTLLSMNSTTGFKRLEATNHDSIDRFYKFKLLENYLIEITVSGMFAYELLWKVGLELKSTIDGHKNMMPYVNGGYTILKIVDKYQGTSFNQIITLGRVGVSLNNLKG